MKTRLLAILGAVVAILLPACATPKFGLGYDFLNQRFTVTVEPQMRDGKSTIKPVK